MFSSWFLPILPVPRPCLPTTQDPHFVQRGVCNMTADRMRGIAVAMEESVGFFVAPERGKDAVACYCGA
jgi:hypothetical protein